MATAREGHKKASKQANERHDSVSERVRVGWSTKPDDKPELPEQLQHGKPASWLTTTRSVRRKDLDTTRTNFNPNPNPSVPAPLK